MSEDEQHQFSAELEALRGAIRIAGVVIGGLLIIAIAGWVAVGVADHFELKLQTARIDKMEPKVDRLERIQFARTEAMTKAP